MHLLIVLIAKYLIALPVLLLLFCIFGVRGKKRKHIVALSVIALPAAYCAGWLAGHFFYNARPFVVDHTTPLFAHAANNGFPSDHMLLGATVAMIGFFLSRRLGLILWILALLVGFARVAAGVHHVLDIVGSSLIAIAVVCAVEYGLRRRSRA